MSDSSKTAGNPVFTYKANFRSVAQSAQRILFYCGILLITVGLLSRFIAFKNHRIKATLIYAPLLGIALIIFSALWALWWRGKLRADFQKEFSATKP